VRLHAGREERSCYVLILLCRQVANHNQCLIILSLSVAERFKRAWQPKIGADCGSEYILPAGSAWVRWSTHVIGMSTNEAPGRRSTHG
jgi:hypothetical protein